jgi:hypothetical protein
MPERYLQEIVDNLRNRLQVELETQLGALNERHEEALEQARQATAAETEQRWSARLQTTEHEWSARLEAEVAAARADAERRLVSEGMRVRVEAEQAAADAAAQLRRELEAAADERAEAIRRELEATADERAAAVRRELEAAVEQRAAAVRQEVEAAAAARAEAIRRDLEQALAAERERAQALLDAEHQRAERLRMDAEGASAAERQRSEAALTVERERLDAERAERERAEAALAAERQQAEARIAAERQKAEREVAEAQRALAAERERLGTLAAQARAASAPVDTTRLVDALRTIDEARSLSDVLALTTAAAAVEAPRAAVFVANGPQLEEWRVPDVPELSHGPIRTDAQAAGLLGNAMAHAEFRASSPTGPMAPAFAALPPNRTAIAVPLLVGEQPIGVIYADEGADGMAPAAWRDAIQILGRHASACLAYLTAVRTAQAVRLMSSGTAGRAAASNGQDDEQAARRYARLLVSEIKLYNEAAVRAGREKRDLGRRLKPEIDRARRLYDERIPPSVAGRDACFQQELVQALADGDAALLG